MQERHPSLSESLQRPSNLEVIESCSVLNALTAEQRLELATGSYLAYADRGEFIWLAGSQSEFFGVVASGFVKMTRSSPTGQDVAVEIFGPGQAFGLIVAIEGKPYPLNAVAICSAWYLKVPTQCLLPVYRRSSSLKDMVVRTIGPSLRRAHEMMARLSSGRAEERIAAVLLLIGATYSEGVPGGFRMTVPLTRQDIAEMAGTTVETTIRTLSRWQKEGVLSTDHQIITVIDQMKLSAFLHSL
jgi:CRP-like cAMP-binding protein